MPTTLSFEDAAPASTLRFEDAAPKPEPLSFEDATPKPEGLTLSANTGAIVPQGSYRSQFYDGPTAVEEPTHVDSLQPQGSPGASPMATEKKYAKDPVSGAITEVTGQELRAKPGEFAPQTYSQAQIDEMDAESKRKSIEAFTQPYVPIPKFDIAKDDNPWLAAGKEAVNLVSGVGEFAESPAGMATAALAEVAPEAVASYFTVDMLHNVGKTLVDSDWKNMTSAERAKAATDVVGQTLMAAFMAKHAKEGVSGKVEAMRAGPAGKLALDLNNAEPTFGSVEQAAILGNAPKTAQALSETADPNTSAQTVSGSPSTEIPDVNLTTRDANPSNSSAKNLNKPVVPETPPEEERGINVSEEIRQKGARTIADIQRLYPLSNLSREQARVLRDQAWGKAEQPVPVASEQPPVTTAATPPVEQPTIKSVPTDSSLIVEPKVETPTPESVRQFVIDSAKKEIESQIASGEIPPTVSSFSQLHDYVDANSYVTDKPEIGALGKAKGWKQNDYADFTNGMVNELDSWLKERSKSNAVDQAPEIAQVPPTDQRPVGETHFGGIPDPTMDRTPIKNIKERKYDWIAQFESGKTHRFSKYDNWNSEQQVRDEIKRRVEAESKLTKPTTDTPATAVEKVKEAEGFESSGKLTPNDLQVGDYFQTHGDNRVAGVSGTVTKVNPKTIVVASKYMEHPQVLTLKKSYLTGELRVKRGDKYYSSEHVETPPQKPEQQTFVGMGGATPTEFDPIGKSPTAMKYKLIDHERAERGLEPIAKPAKVSDPVAFAKAEAAFDNDPTVGSTLVKDILDGKRKTIEDWESHVLLLQKIGVRDQYYKSAREAAQAFEDGRLDDVAEANIRTAEWADKLNDVEQASRISGSARGRALRSLWVMANEDMTLASLEMQKRATKGGAPLTVDERAQLQKVVDEYKTKLDAYEKYQAARETKIKEDAFKEAFARVQQENKTPQYHPKVLERAEQLVTKLEVKASAALKDLLGATWSPGPEVLGKMALVGAAKLARGVLEVSKWTDAMVRDLGERFRPYAQQVYDLANKELEKQLGPSAKVVREKGDLNQQRDAIGERIAEKVKDGKKDELTGYIQRLAKVFYKQGVVTREGMVDALHGFLEPITKMTQREVSDAFSGYGDFKQLSKDQITVALRGMKGELQQLAKLEDMAAGKPPLKSGVERRSKTDVERQIEKLVNEAKYKFQIPITDPNTQLKSALDTFKTQMTNRIKDYQQRLADKDFAPRPRRELVLDATALRLKAEAERVKNKFQQAMRAEQLKNRPKWEKTFEQAAGVARFSALSGYHTLAKLFSYTLAKLAEIPLVESTGAVLSRVPGLRPIFEKANLESGSTGKSISALYSGFAIKGMKAAAQVLRTGTTDAKSVYGKVNIDPPRWYDFFGTLHSAEKAPLQTGSMEMYIRRGTENAIKAGLDPRDEFVRAQINKEAYDYSQRDILMENNKFAEAINMLHKRLEQKNPKTGKVDVENALVSTLAKTFLTKGIVRTPANYIAQTIARTPIGLATGVLKAGMAHYRGIGNLHPAEANAVARLLKVGAVGSAFFLLGMIDATKPQDERTFGGYWEPGRKRGGDDVEWGKIRLFGKELPHIMTHNPLTESAQMGSTMMRVALARLKKDSPENKGLTAGAVKALVGLAGKAPVSSPLMRLGEGRANVAGDLVKGLVPQLLQNIAEDTDDTERSPKTAFEQFETAVPGLRQDVPEKVNRR